MDFRSFHDASVSLISNKALLFGDYAALEKLSFKERGLLSYRRTGAVVRKYGFRPDDIANLSPKYWALCHDPILCLDGAISTLLTIHLNLACGTILDMADEREDLGEIVEDLLSFKTIGQFLLTELGHGLDTTNLETEVALQSDGSFLLNSPSMSAAKFMPPTIPMGIPTIGVIFARLRIGTEIHGIRAFLVPLNDGKKMYPGVRSRLLPHRRGTNPINHSLTTFSSVHLPPTSLLGPPISPSDKPPPLAIQHLQFLSSLWRIAVGSISLGNIIVTGLKCLVTICYLYSKRRTVLGIQLRPANTSRSGTNNLTNPIEKPILSFRSQQIPIVTSLAQTYVLGAFRNHSITLFENPNYEGGIELQNRQAISVCVKAAGFSLGWKMNITLSERCGAQGLMEYSLMSQMLAEGRGIAVAEGDLVVLSIKMVRELLSDRVAFPTPQNRNSHLAIQESKLFTKLRRIWTSQLISGMSKSDYFDRYIAPSCIGLIELIGYRIAYDAASEELPRTIGDRKVVRAILDLFESSVSPSTSSNEPLGDKDGQTDPIDTLLPHLESLVNGLNVRQYIEKTVPIVSDEGWEKLVKGLVVYGSGEDSGKQTEESGRNAGLEGEDVVVDSSGSVAIFAHARL